ncbi:DEAD/DEAH box helicase family protein [Halosquirtibacter xylanolyticus]|nr:DEAD/DEAH box helicase family protein [Prolixibacteraceae bacterium]
MNQIDKRKLSEADIRSKFITPAIENAGWDIMTQIREEEHFTDGRIIVQGNMSTRGASKFADYILYYKPNIPIAIIEAKDNKHAIGAGMQQALEYADIRQVPFVFSSNGDAFIFHDKTSNSIREYEISLDEFPSPDSLWKKYLKYKNIETKDAQKVIEQPFFNDDSGMSPRYYQQNAINRTIEAMAKDQKRILLVMATGTGKTYTAFQIAHRLKKANKVNRILFLADRNILLSQTKNGDFSSFDDSIMHIIKNKQIDKSYEIYFALYQGLVGNEDQEDAYLNFSPSFFDLVIIDECHRGSASEASAWRVILDYFSSAIHIGLTATPKETIDVSNMSYFGEPVYTYSLKQGIEDGFLAPYKVVRIDTNIDNGWRPTQGMVDKYDNQITDRIYNLKDYDRSLIIDERTQLVAQKVTEYLTRTDRFAKTIIFCVDIDHAARMRQALINCNIDMLSQHNNYVVKITGDDDFGKNQLDNFIDIEEPCPVIATTSKLLTTGVDTKMVKVIVLDVPIGSMTEFKQIIGRGTRIRESDNKTFFTILDFRRNTDKFADPSFDGTPVQVYIPTNNDSPVPPSNDESGEIDPELSNNSNNQKPSNDSLNVSDSGSNYSSSSMDDPKRFYINNIEVSVTREQVQYLSPSGKLIIESLKDYTRKNVNKNFDSIEIFRHQWNLSKNKKELITKLTEQGILFEALKEQIGRDLDPFDLICHVAFDQPILTRKERAKKVLEDSYFHKYSEKAQNILSLILDKYIEEGVEVIEDREILTINPLNTIGSPVEIVREFGSASEYDHAIQQLEMRIYQPA